MQDKKKILLVEGYNDKGVIEQVLNAYGINVDIEIKVCGGVDVMSDELIITLISLVLSAALIIPLGQKTILLLDSKYVQR